MSRPRRKQGGGLAGRKPAKAVRFATCPAPGCGKISYPTRAEAKRAQRQHRSGQRMSVYPCRHDGGDGFHNGHLPKAVTEGLKARDELRANRRRPTRHIDTADVTLEP